MLFVWLILNGRVTAEICLFGVGISAALIFFMCRFMDYSLKKELLLFRLIPFLIGYFWVLIKEIVKANVCVLKIILSPELQPEPALVYFDTKLKSGVARMMLANSITLTPGTITVSVEKQRFCVSTQHYTFVANAFVELVQQFGQERIDAIRDYAF